MRRAILLVILATIVFATAMTAAGLRWTAVADAASCGCVTPKLEKWFATNKVASSGGISRLQADALRCANAFTCTVVANNVIDKAKKVKGMTLDQYKLWRQCPGSGRWCKAAVACFIAGASEYVIDLAQGDSEAVASQKATHACLVAAVAVGLSAATPRDVRGAQWAK